MARSALSVVTGSDFTTSRNGGTLGAVLLAQYAITLTTGAADLTLGVKEWPEFPLWERHEVIYAPLVWVTLARLTMINHR